MKIRLTVEEAERIACALCFCQIELEANAHDPDIASMHRELCALSAAFYESMSKRFRDAAEKSRGSVKVDIE